MNAEQRQLNLFPWEQLISEPLPREVIKHEKKISQSKHYNDERKKKQVKKKREKRKKSQPL